MMVSYTIIIINAFLLVTIICEISSISISAAAGTSQKQQTHQTQTTSFSLGDASKHEAERKVDQDYNIQYGTEHVESDRGANEQEDDETEDDDDDADDNDNNGGAETDDRNCTCNGASCLCCINMNLSFIDLGGPGCVKFAYIASNDSLAVDMSYGTRLLQSNLIKRGTSEPTCMDLFSDLAQMCTRFTKVAKVEKGVKGCITVEPLLLGIVQATYNVGCFNMDEESSQSIAFIPDSITQSNHVTGKPSESNEEEDGEELAAAFSQSAEDGIAWFNTLISSVLGEDGTSSSSNAANETSPSNVNTSTQSYNKTEQRQYSRLMT